MKKTMKALCNHAANCPREAPALLPVNGGTAMMRCPAFQCAGGENPLAEHRPETNWVLEGFDVTGFLSRFLRDQNGATAIEYGLIAGGIALAIVAAVALLGDVVKGKFESVDAAWP
jgi:pilus assembly protein Flp/PilA